MHTLQEIGFVFEEATVLGAEVREQDRVAGVTLSVLTLTSEGHEPLDPRISLRLSPVGRVAASLRNGLWSDPAAPVEAFPLAQLLHVVQSFGACPIYGGRFFDVHSSDQAKWHGKFSFDILLGTIGLSHSFSLSQSAGSDRHLDLCI